MDCCCSVISNSLQPYGHARLPCLSPSPRVCSNSCPLIWWCHSIILPFVIPFSSCLQSFLASGFFSNELALCIRCPKYLRFSISPSTEYSELISLRLTDLIFLWSKRLSRVFSGTTVKSIKSLVLSLLYGPVVKNPCVNAGATGDAGSIPELRRFLGVENGNPLHYSCLENSLDKGAWWATVHGVSKSQTWLSAHAQNNIHAWLLEKS